MEGPEGQRDPISQDPFGYCQESKNGLKAKKIKLPQMKFLLKKTLTFSNFNKFSCTYQPLSFCKIFKKFLGLIQSYEDVPFLSPKWPTCPEQIFFWHKSLLLLSSTYWPFSLCKIFKNSYCESRVMRMHHFWAQNGPFAPNKFFFGKLLISFSSTYQPLSLCKIFKKFFQRIQSYEDVQFLGQKYPISPNQYFFQKTC